MPNAEEIEIMQMTRDQQEEIEDLKRRVKALEKLADEKDGRPSEAGHTKGKK